MIENTHTHKHIHIQHTQRERLNHCIRIHNLYKEVDFKFSKMKITMRKAKRKAKKKKKKPHERSNNQKKPQKEGVNKISLKINREKK